MNASKSSPLRGETIRSQSHHKRAELFIILQKFEVWELKVLVELMIKQLTYDKTNLSLQSKYDTTNIDSRRNKVYYFAKSRIVKELLRNSPTCIAKSTAYEIIKRWIQMDILNENPEKSKMVRFTDQAIEAVRFAKKRKMFMIPDI